MRLAESVVVVTGGGNGIGAALSRRFAGQGASVVVNDLDADAARAVAAEVGGLAVPGDAASEQGVADLVGAATERYGRIDLFCANAGVADAGGPEAEESAWARSLEVNVMAHVRAARAVLPQWLERGEGRFLATVSAAGLLTMLGSAPYAVSKHAALAFAEWMSITYADRGITVQALCPQGVRTNLLDGTGETGKKLLADAAIEPEQVADEVLAALQDDRFLILPHPEVAQYYALRATDPAKWHGGMRKLQRGLA
ncbi:SDR family oxidoreductase [Saccharopolyspora gloriosae]|uniref:NAD(P)-dependent dehydrogenase (Short-subunit alcohol dehydrogenase family) n=1 Tax=Saccharopolyspora gloriosae TaxID=455344 RepID=A0A840NNI8_9PSEU|nr:SDR family oxidoreductase [Saccharopolyspora gloriosae]MBB5070849.1 NAD(P)-dependent dehydrogenase (short-subunit alcohol dehydrogenase family) [Saccharopolyspora gloriosae]